MHKPACIPAKDLLLPLRFAWAPAASIAVAVVAAAAVTAFDVAVRAQEGEV